MTDSSVQFIKAQNIAPVKGYSNPLYEGSSVFVRVLGKNSDGSYKVSFAGQRFNVKSSIELAEGQSFRAVVKASGNGIIELVQESTVNAGNAEDSSLFQILAAQGFIPDSVTEKLLQFLQQSGLKIDRSIIARARQIAVKFPGRETQAAEIAALLMEKGLDASESSVEALLLFLEGNGGKEKNQQEQSEYREEEKKNNFLEKLFGKDNVLEAGRKEGMLTLVNQLREGNCHWVVLPFEWTSGSGEAKGFIRLLIDINEKNLKKLQIQCEFPMKTYAFVLYYKNSKVKEIRYCTLPPLLTPEISKEEKRLGDLFSSGMNCDNSVPVTYSASALVNGLCADDEEPLVIDHRA